MVDSRVLFATLFAVFMIMTWTEKNKVWKTLFGVVAAICLATMIIKLV